MKLELVQVFFRHGSRMVLQAEAQLVGVTDDSLYTQGFGQLTEEGRREVHALGLALRKRYDEFLGDYRRERVHAHSTNTDRTRESLQLVLDGLYPPAESEKSIASAVMFVEPRETDPLLMPFFTPYFRKAKQEEIACSGDYRDRNARFAEFLSSMREKMGFDSAEDALYVGWTYYAITIHRALNLPLPSWCSDEMLATLKELFMLLLDGLSSTERLRRLTGGPMVRRVIENMRAGEPRRIYLYSAHDVTLAVFVRAQRIDLPGIPAVGSAVVVEKHRDERGREFVRVLLWNGKEFAASRIGDCDEFCPLERYLEVTKDVIPSDEELALLSQEGSG